jgi:hypothetical protein
MKSYLPVLLVLLTCATALAQKTSTKEAFIIQGQLTNFKGNDLIFFSGILLRD